MSQQISKKTLINWDLVTVNPNNKNWNWKDLFCFWGVNIQSVIGFSLITSLYLIYNLNTFVVFFFIVFGSLLVYFFSNLIGNPLQKFGLPFVVLLRSSLGIKGAKYFGFLRGLVGIFMFGIQTYFLSKMLSYLIRIVLFSIEPSSLDQDIFLTFLFGLNLIDWSSIVIAIIFQTFLFSIGMKFNRKIILSEADVEGVMTVAFDSPAESPRSPREHPENKKKKTTNMTSLFLPLEFPESKFMVAILENLSAFVNVEHKIYFFLPCKASSKRYPILG